jgi:hypothetical protein
MLLTGHAPLAAAVFSFAGGTPATTAVELMHRKPLMMDSMIKRNTKSQLRR